MDHKGSGDESDFSPASVNSKVREGPVIIYLLRKMGLREFVELGGGGGGD